MDRIYITLAMDLTANAPDGAGWYIDIIRDGVRVMNPMPVPPETAYELSQDFLRAMQDSDHELPPNFTPQMLVQAGNQGIYAAIQTQLAYAEEQASKIASLRKKLATAPPPTRPQPPATLTLEQDENRQQR